ncbi:MAG TPA: FtsX-like permease family protein [Acidobacteriota bacterium]
MGVLRAPEREGERGALPFLHHVTPDYFATLGSPLIAGRGFTAQDHAGAPPVIIVTRRTAAAYWPDEDAIGQCLRTMDASECWEVVGIVEDTLWNVTGTRGPEEVFTAWAQMRARTSFPLRALYVRVRKPSAIGPVLADLRASEPDLPYMEVASLWSQMDGQTRSWRLGATVFSLFGVLALALATVGIFGLLAFVARQRAPEIGVRVALGANRRDVIGLVVRQGMFFVVLGWALGVAASLALTRYVESLLFDVTPTDPATFAAASGLIAIVAALAFFLPARRAASVDPALVLRSE